GVWLYHPHPTDFRRWTRDGLRDELQLRGFQVETSIPVVGPLAWTTQFRLLGFRHALAKIPYLGAALCYPLAVLMNLRMAVADAVPPKSIHETNACVYVMRARKPASQGVAS